MIRGCYYYSQGCKICGKVVYGESEKSRKKARKDFYWRMKRHQEQEHENGTGETREAKTEK